MCVSCFFSFLFKVGLGSRKGCYVVIGNCLSLLLKQDLVLTDNNMTFYA